MIVGGSAMSAAALRIASTACPSATPGAVSKFSVLAGYWPTCVYCSGASCSVIVANADSGVGCPLLEIRFSLPIPAALVARPGCASRMTRYWFVSVKIVDTIRWPNALYSASSTALAVIPRREAVSRSTLTLLARPCAPASLLTLRTCGTLRSRSISVPIHCVISAPSTPSSDTRYSDGPVSASIVRSCVGCR